MYSPDNTAEGSGPTGYLNFKAIKRSTSNGGRVEYIGSMPIRELIAGQFIVPVASEGLAPEVLKMKSSGGPVQRKTYPTHVQEIVDYIATYAENDEPWAFNSIVLYSTVPLEFEGVSFGFDMSGEARAQEVLSVGEGLHRCLAWAVVLGLAKIRGVKRPQLSKQAQKRIERASIPVVVIEEPDLKRQRVDFNSLNKQKPLTATVMTLTADSVLSDLTKAVIADVPLFKGRIDLNNNSVGAKSDMLLSFSQLRFVVASYLFGSKTRSPKAIEQAAAELCDDRGFDAVRADLKDVFTKVASNLGGLERLQKETLTKTQAGDIIRGLREATLLASNAAWRSLFVAIHDAGDQGVDPATAITQLRRQPNIWSRNDEFFVGSLIDGETGKLLSSRESIDAAALKLRRVACS